ncbi:uncharacterized protein LOC113345856 isoform X2 [Papaver somniferum]|uniref:uncharacterized protein LOC113284872 isoform X2 n=1 Tax=Papaver somniferum TaxID=3469 RepID=UPI000E700749|nr:uncharacterized protein LOC113284872 isoform X2 [Papaver somniferum]XP_026389973.1 uncharacterized protein LOC113284872 isoform X2 [Papaver somniferum]XP_026445300.1 uncharacterized protein LOC113345856 isoform X2 [Papaver somniferum]XP_026445301.1 uncharacterized protein LOC113345856 isoform X2 [Papaver somniferum]
MKVKAKTPHKTQSREPVAAKHVAHLVQTLFFLKIPLGYCNEVLVSYPFLHMMILFSGSINVELGTSPAYCVVRSELQSGKLTFKALMESAAQSFVNNGGDQKY